MDTFFQPMGDRLDEITETIVSIPYEGTDESEPDEPGSSEVLLGHVFTPTELKYRDLPDGPQMRTSAYENTWRSCRNKMQDVMRELHAPIIKKVTSAVLESYQKQDPLMPYVELPTIALSGGDKSTTTSILEEIKQSLISGISASAVFTPNSDDAMSDGQPSPSKAVQQSAFVSTLSAADCNNLTSAFKTLIKGFIEVDPNGSGHKAQTQPKSGPKPSVSSVLAPYDINVLEAWFNVIRRVRDEKHLPRLVVFVNDFEKIDPTIMHDIFYICSLHIPRLPLVFVLALSSPVVPSYLHVVYPRTTLTLLCLTRIEVKCGLESLEKVLLGTFFNPEFEPTIMLSPAALEFSVNQFHRNAMSLDFVASVLQLIHLRHFAEPLSIFALDELLGEDDLEDAAEKLEEPSSRPFLNALLARLHHPEKSKPSPKTHADGDIDAIDRPPRSPKKGKGKSDSKDTTAETWHVRTGTEALDLVRAARNEHIQRVRESRFAFQIFLVVRTYLAEAGHKNGVGGMRGRERTLCEMMCACLRGTLPEREGWSAAGALKKLPSPKLSAFISELYSFVHALSAEIRSAEADIMVKLVGWNARLSAPSADIDEISAEVGEWLIEFMSERMRDYSEFNLWDIWYASTPSGLSELFNPSPRTSITTALMHPERYLSYGNEANLNAEATYTRPAKSKSIEIPDTSILFQRYLESGRMINVYDWFESFSGALDAQRRKRRKEQKAEGKRDRETHVVPSGDTPENKDQRPTRNGPRLHGRGPRASPRKGKGKAAEPVSTTSRKAAKGKVGAVLESDGDEESQSEEEDEDEKERWKMEVQARFLRSVQELDFLGFIKHTGRKADHVQKTAYDVPE